MSKRNKRKKGSASELDAIDRGDLVIARFPDEEPIDDYLIEAEDLTELAVWVCEQCFDGLIRLPLRDGPGRWIDQGIDLFFNQAPVKEQHRCSFSRLKTSPPTKDSDLKLAFARATHRRGKWRAKKLALPLEVKERILEQDWVSPGPPTDEARLRSRK